jgi:hypothetical protein
VAGTAPQAERRPLSSYLRNVIEDAIGDGKEADRGSAIA